MRFVKAALLSVIVVSLSVMWSSRHTVADAYETTPNTLQLRLSGVDLAVASTELTPSPYAIPAAPDTRRQPVPARSAADAAEPLALVATSGGGARIRGTAFGPEGPVLGATVRIERHTKDGIGVLHGTADAEGRWGFENLPGGRYRVRAWVPGLLTTGRSEVAFLADDGTAEFAFTLWGVDPAPTLEFVAAGPIYQGHTGTVAVVVSRRSVDVNGIVVTTGVIGDAVSVEVSPDVVLASSPVQFTDFQGSARFILSCPAAGLGSTGSAGVLVARTAEQLATFPLPGCQPVPPPPVVPDAVDPSNGAEATTAAGAALSTAITAVTNGDAGV